MASPNKNVKHRYMPMATRWNRSCVVRRLHGLMRMEGVVKLEELGVKESNNEFYDCIVSIPWYGKEKDVYVRFDKDDKNASPTPKQLQAFKNLLDEAPEVFSKLEEQLFSYYLKKREESKGEDYFVECFPEVISPKELEKYLRFRSIGVCYYDDDWSSYIGFIIDCDWDVELGIGVKLIKNRVREIDVQDIVL